MRNAPSLALSIVGLFLLGGVAQADQITFKADLASAAEVPPVTSPGKGSATASLDTTTKTLTWTVTYSGLSVDEAVVFPNFGLLWERTQVSLCRSAVIWRARSRVRPR